MADPIDARHTALTILNRIDDSGQTLDSIVGDIFDRHPGLSGPDKALTHAIVYGVLRWRGRIDWFIHHFSKTPVSKIRPDIMNILRIGIFQILYLDRIPNSAAVNTAVEMAKKTGPKWISGFVNGILRNMIRHHDSVVFPDMDKNPALALASSKSFPSWLISRWLHRYGIESTSKICDAVNIIPPMTVRVNPLLTTRKKCCDLLMEAQVKATVTPYSPLGLYLENLNMRISDLTAFKKGWLQVQDEAAQLVTYLLNPLPGETILDACAGLGGKTTHIAQLMGNKGKIIAMDSNEEKLKRLSLEMTRLNITTVETCLHDLYLPFDKHMTFDRIFLDAPCSGLGVLRRNPDTKWNRNKKKLKQYQTTQISFLKKVAPLVKPKGKLVYAVCSLEPEENEAVIQSFLRQHPFFEIDLHPAGLPAEAVGLMNNNGYFKACPYPHNTDGFFSVCMTNSSSR